MKELYRDFERAGKELDVLIEEGYFGEKSLHLLSLRDKKDTNEVFYQSINSFIEDSTNLDRIIVWKYIETLFTLYIEAMKTEAKKLTDILAQFMTGTKESPELEFQSAYNEYIISDQEYENSLRSIRKKQDIKTFEKKESANKLIRAYKNGVEFINKILIPCISISRLINKQDYNIFSINKKTLNEKIEIFNKITENKYSIITDTIDREIRNAEAHLLITFNIEKGNFVIKTRENGKLINRELPYSEMFAHYSKVSNFIRAFIFSNLLLILSVEDNERFNDLVRRLSKQ